MMRTRARWIAAVITLAISPLALAGDEAAREAKEAKEIVRTLGGGISDAKRAELETRFEALDIRARIPALVEGLAPERRVKTQKFAIERITRLNMPVFAAHLAHLASTPAAKVEVRDEADAAARKVHADTARRWYERVVLNDFQSRRTLALDRVANMAMPESVPVLARVVATCGLEVRAQVAALTDLREVNVNLGSAGNAATQVPIQLPTASLISVETNIQVPTETKMFWKNTALRGLKAIAGDKGSEPEAYLVWWKEKQAAATATPATNGASSTPNGTK